MKLDMDGNKIGIYNLIEGFEYGMLGHLKFINDSLMMGNASWGNFENKKNFNTLNKINAKGENRREDIFSRFNNRDAFANLRSAGFANAVIFDTLGNIIKERGLNHYMSHMIRTHDNKYLFLTNSLPEEEENPSVYLHKFNENLEYDSIYTQEYEYDYLCKDTINTDTIHIKDCDIEVGIMDMEVKGEDALMNVYPNPVTDMATIKLPIYTHSNIKSKYISGTHTNYAWHKNALVQVFDIEGRLVKEQKLTSGQTEMKLDVSGWNPGLYVVRLLVGGERYCEAKVVKK